MTITWSRSPDFSSALMFALNIGMVVVRNAEKPRMSGWCSRTASMNFSGDTCTPRSITSNPAPSNMMFTRFLPMSCTSPLTVPMTTLPIVAALEPGADLLQRRDQRVVEQSLRAQAHPEPGVGQLKHGGTVAHQGVVVQLLEKLVGGHAAPSLCAL